MRPSGEVILAEYQAGSLYQQILESAGINPDTVLIRVNGVFVPQDSEVRSERAEILLTCSRG